MPENPEQILLRIARLPEVERRVNSEELRKRFRRRLKTGLQRHVLDCLLGLNSRNRVARAWADALIDEAHNDDEIGRDDR